MLKIERIYYIYWVDASGSEFPGNDVAYSWDFIEANRMFDDTFVKIHEGKIKPPLEGYQLILESHVNQGNNVFKVTEERRRAYKTRN